MKVLAPRIEITLSKIQHNARILCERYGQRGISIMGVSKAILGEPAIAKAMLQGGVEFIADSHLENIIKMRNAGLLTRFVLLRTALSQAESIVQNVDISLNTEIETVGKLDHFANAQHKIHQIIVMVELGDLREGILPCNLSQFIEQTSHLSNIEVIGIGCNLACYGGIKPNNQKMHELSELTNVLEQDFRIRLPIVSGGNSANYEWYKSAPKVERINNLRIGESILLGCETLHRDPIPGLHANAFKLIAEVIESKQKPSLPNGEISQDAFGNIPTFLDRGIHHRVIIALGRQDILPSSLKPEDDLEILGSSSDHVVLDSKHLDLKIGSEVKFDLDYGGLLAAMTSPFIQKKFVEFS